MEDGSWLLNLPVTLDFSDEIIKHSLILVGLASNDWCRDNSFCRDALRHAVCNRKPKHLFLIPFSNKMPDATTQGLAVNQVCLGIEEWDDPPHKH